MTKKRKLIHFAIEYAINLTTEFTTDQTRLLKFELKAGLTT